MISSLRMNMWRKTPSTTQFCPVLKNRFTKKFFYLCLIWLSAPILFCPLLSGCYERNQPVLYIVPTKGLPGASFRAWGGGLPTGKVTEYRIIRLNDNVTAGIIVSRADQNGNDSFDITTAGYDAGSYLCTLIGSDGLRAAVSEFKIIQKGATHPENQETNGFNDDFSDPSSGWDIRSNNMGEWGYEAGEYSIYLKKSGNVIGDRNESKTGLYKDFSVEVETKKISKTVDDSAVGLIFRMQDAKNAYSFWIRSSSGTYCLVKTYNGVPDMLVSWAFSRYINRDNIPNKLKVACNKDHIEVDINGHGLLALNDATFSMGYVQLGVSSWSSDDCHYHFDNFTIHEIE